MSAASPHKGFDAGLVAPSSTIDWFRPNDYSAALRSNSDLPLNADQELYLRQKAALQAQILGNRIRLKQFCINTAIVCMHRMFLVHDITKLNSVNFIAASLFLAAKVEETPISLESCAELVMSTGSSKIESRVPNNKSIELRNIMNDIVAAENLMLHSLGFDLEIIHPHYMIISFCKKLKLPNELVKVAYTLGTYILVLSNLCVRYKPSVLACVCINLAYKCCRNSIMNQITNKNTEKLVNENNKIADFTHYSAIVEDNLGANFQGEHGKLLRQAIIPLFEKGDWVSNFEPELSTELLEKLTNEYLTSIHRTPNELKKTLINQTFSGNEPEHGQIIEFLLSNVSTRPIVEKREGHDFEGKTFDSEEPPNKSGLVSSEYDSGPNFNFGPSNLSDDRNDRSTTNTLHQTFYDLNDKQNNRLFLTYDEFSKFTNLFTAFIQSQKDRIRDSYNDIVVNKTPSNNVSHHKNTHSNNNTIKL